MKKQTAIGIGMLILVSCNENQNENSVSDLKEDSTAVTDIFQSAEFSLFEFPTKWYMLHATGDSSGYVMNQWCDAEMQQITIELSENNLRSFTFNFGQEQLTWKMLNFQAKSIVDNSRNYVEGSFSLTPIDGATVTPDAVEFYWNRTEKWCSFKGEVIGNNRFVNEEEKGAYELVEEDCSDF